MNSNSLGICSLILFVIAGLSTLKFILKHYREERAKEDAKKDLESIKSIYSERTYYRFKKRINELGFKI